MAGGGGGWLIFTVRKQREGIDAFLNHASVAVCCIFIYLDICFVTKVKLSKIIEVLM